MVSRFLATTNEFTCLYSKVYCTNCCDFLEETQFIDYRFVKDLELRQQPRFCCCCVGKELLIFADDKDSVSTRQTKEAVTQSAELAPVAILHPEAQKAEAIVRNAWADSQLISD